MHVIIEIKEYCVSDICKLFGIIYAHLDLAVQIFYK